VAGADAQKAWVTCRPSSSATSSAVIRSTDTAIPTPVLVSELDGPPNWLGPVAIWSAIAIAWPLAFSSGPAQCRGSERGPDSHRLA